MEMTRNRASRSDHAGVSQDTPVKVEPALARTDSVGNQARLRRLGAPLSRKLAVGKSDDPLEREADAAAEQVVGAGPMGARSSAGSASLSRKDGSLEDEDTKSVRRRATAASTRSEDEAPPIVHQVLAESGHSLDPGVQATMSDRFGADFSGVRVHTDARAAESAAAVNAHAYSTGEHIVFGAGRYAPGDHAGQKLIAHELAHTLQQSAAPAVRRDGPEVPLKEAKKEEAKEALGGGVKDAADKLSKDDKIKDLGLGVLKSFGEPIWNGASTPDKVAMIAGGAALVGIPLTALASDRAGRGVLSGLPLGKPLSLVPYSFIDDGSFDLPKSKTDPLLIHLTVKADDYIDLLREKYDFLPKMTLSYEFTMSISPDRKFSMPFGLVRFSPTPGLGFAGGYGVASDQPTLTSPGDGAPLAPYKSYPSPATAAPPAGWGVGFVADFTKFGPLKTQISRLLGDVPDK
jgi:hypothetical protein